MKIYTKTGDAGETGLFAGGRVRKDDLRVEAYGSVDELNSHLGLAAAMLSGRPPAARLQELQGDLMILGADLATPQGAKSASVIRLGDAAVFKLESEIDEMEKGLPELRNFVLPGGRPPVAQLHVARTVCRRAERRVVALSHREEIGGVPVRFLNRLSDWLFVAARSANAAEGDSEQPWRPKGSPSS